MIFGFCELHHTQGDPKERGAPTTRTEGGSAKSQRNRVKLLFHCNDAQGDRAGILKLVPCADTHRPNGLPIHFMGKSKQCTSPLDFDENQLQRIDSVVFGVQ